jgi:hypothetical protein
MTGRGIIAEEAGVRIRIKLSAKDAAAWLTEVAPKLKPVEISFDETLSSIADCKKDGVMGGAIHDYMHGRACEKSKSDALLTRNTSNFKCLPITALVQWP